MAGPNDMSFTSGRFSLDIGGHNVGFLKKFSGLAMEADIVTHDLGPDNVQKKNVANIKWSTAKCTMGIGMGHGMYTWIKAAFDKAVAYKDGTFTSANFDYKAQSRLNFSRALITSVTVPKLDASSKDAAYFDIEFDAENVDWEKAGGEDIRAKLGPVQKAWLCSNFRLELGDLPCDNVSTIDSFTWKCSVAPDHVGIRRLPSKHPAKVTVPDLKVSVSQLDHPRWADAARKWFISGDHREEHEMNGRIVFLGPNTNDELGEITLMNVGFKKFQKDDFEANSEKIARFTAELYVEKMDFKINEYDA